MKDVMLQHNTPVLVILLLNALPVYLPHKGPLPFKAEQGHRQSDLAV